MLAKVRLSNGKSLVAGRRLTGFTNAEEQGFGKKWAASYPSFLEDGLRKAGARFEQGRVMLPFAVSDGRIVTGQNPFSTALSVDATLRAMGRQPAARELYKDERALLLVARFLGGDVARAKAELAAAPEAHDLMLVGIYGTIVADEAGDDLAGVTKGLALIELVADRLAEPRLELAMAKAEHRLGRSADARGRLKLVLAKNPKFEPAKALLATIPEEALMEVGPHANR